MGLFADQNLKKGDFIGAYNSEILCKKEDKSRGVLQKIFGSSYLFVAHSSYYKILDAEFYGNYTRSINHLPYPHANCAVEDVHTTNYAITIFKAGKKINQGDELFFDYGKTFDLDWKHK